MIEKKAFEYPEELFEEEEFSRLVSFSKGLSDSASHSDIGLPQSTIDSLALNSFGNYKLTRLLGEGDLCRTFLALEGGSSKQRVVKQIHPEAIDRLSRHEFNAAALKIHQESMTAASVAPELVTPIVEFGEVDGQYFYAMEYVEGKSLAKLTKSSTMPNRIAAEIAQSVAESLHKLHRAGIVPGNIQPSNLIVDSQRYPHLLDASLASMNPAEQIDSPFQAPEVTNREDINSAAEIWSLGAVLYTCLVGEAPGKAVVPPRKLNSKVARDLETICLTCLHEKPHRRYSTMAELAEDLNLFLEYQPIMASPRSFIGKLANCMSRLA